MASKVYQWHGEPVKVRFGTYLVEQVKDKPLYWYNYEVVALEDPEINCVEVTPKGGKPFYIYNGHGYGVRKLEAGGWPNMGHMSLPSDPENFTEYSNTEWNVVKFHCINEDMTKFNKLDELRRSWFELMYPKEYSRMQAMKDFFKENNPITSINF